MPIFDTPPRRAAALYAGLLQSIVIAGATMLATTLCGAAPNEAADLAPVTFNRDVMAVLSKAGCNAGTCHGNINGKGGFRLSLRGQDPEFDFRQLVRSADGRRINRIDPEQSLMLLKATAQLAHQGGKRFDIESQQFAILTKWIERGLAGPDPQTPSVSRLSVSPSDQVVWDDDQNVPLEVIADYTDGSTANVTTLAVYESSDPLVRISANGIVHFDRPGLVTVLVRYLDAQVPVRLAYRHRPAEFTWSDPPVNNFVDRFVFDRLRQLEINPAPLADDSTFLRRVSLDLLGVLPSMEQAKAFVDDTSADKRRRVVDEMLQRPEFAQMWAQKWSDLIRNEEKTNDAVGVEKLHTWMRDSFLADRPLDEFVSQLIAGAGSTYENPPANFWRAHREPFIRAETTAQVFLGVRLQCAKCHNHPFDHWSQDQYYQWASLFAGIDYEIVENNRRDNLDKHEFVGDQIVKLDGDALVKNVRTGKDAAATFLGADEPVADDRIRRLGQWITSPENRMFAKTQANRIWFHLMGIGLVDPVDDLRLTNPASHPKLLERLADELVANDYSVKHLVRTIVLSRTYQLASDFPGTQGDPNGYAPQMFGRAVIRRLTAEQILDAQSHVLGLPAEFQGYPTGTRAIDIVGVQRVRGKLNDGDLFLRQFGKPERLLACECERSDQPTLGQALSLVGGDSLHRRLRAADNRIGKLLDESDDVETVIDALVWTALSRPPTSDELSVTSAMIASSGDRRGVLEDFVWALLNAKELLFRN
jgi:hypothetical protein